MPVKFKLGFTIDAETLFGILSRFLPVEDLSVEEVAQPIPSLSKHVVGLMVRDSKPKPVRAPQVRRTKGSGYKLNLYAGCNAIIMNVLSDNEPHPGTHIAPAMVAAGYAVNGLYGRLERLRLHGYIVKVPYGKWRLTPKGKLAWEAPPAPASTPSQESAA